MKSTRSRRRLVPFVSAALMLATLGGALGASAAETSDEPIYRPGTAPMRLSEEAEERLLERDIAFESRLTAGDIQLTWADLGPLQAAAYRQAKEDRHERGEGTATDPATFNGSWSNVGASPIFELTRSTPILELMNGRIGALAIRQDGTFILGGAQGGIWVLGPTDTVWTPKTDNLPSLAIGALAVAPSNDLTVYAGTGEGALSGDSSAGNGVLKSTDGGTNWSHVSGDYFQAVAISRIVVDPTDENHLYAAVLRGRGGARRVSPPVHSRFGIWESTNGGATWTQKRDVLEENGATDLEMDPQDPAVLYASFWGDAIYKSTNGGSTWTPIMNGLPTGVDYAEAPTRFSIGISHPDPSVPATLYTGFQVGEDPAHVYKSTDGGANWAQVSDGTGDDVVADYCGGQCWYDNVIEVDPTDPSVAYAGGQFNYGIGSGGIFRSDDGGATWLNLGWDQHPDFHAFAFDPNDSNHILSGSDGGVWESADRGGRTDPGDALDAVTWVTLNAGGLSIAQFTSIATNPAWTEESGNPFPSRIWGGTQDNGTLRHATNPANPGMTDVSSGDGGQVLVDPTDPNFVYGTYFGISPYRFDNGGAFLFSNQGISQGIDLSDRSDFYTPWVLNKDNPDQLFLGSFRVYRTNDAKAPSPGDVVWEPISDDLTGRCTGTAPNGARTCALSAFGLGGGTGLYAGSLDGFVWVSPNAQTADSPRWTKVGGPSLPNRPVQSIAVDRSNYRIAYLAYGGFSKSTPGERGHVYATIDAGRSWKDISGNLPDSPVNSIVADPSYAKTLYAGTDVGPYVTYNGGKTWSVMGGTSHAIVGIWQLDLDPSHGVLLSGTHGRGAYGMVDETPRPALVLDKVDAGIPVGPGSNIDYTITLRNIGTGDATGVVLTDRVPKNTSFVSASNGGSEHSGRVWWKGLTVPAGGSITSTMTVKIRSSLPANTTAIGNDDFKAASAQGPFTTGSPVVTPIADPYAVSITPATQTDGGKVGTTVTYPVTLTNRGFNPDSYTLSATGGSYGVSFFESDCTTGLAVTGTLSPGSGAEVCVAVDVPAGASDGEVNDAKIIATSTASPSVSGSATVSTIAVAVATLIVDGDANIPDVQAYYTAALAAGTYQVWDLAVDSSLPSGYLGSFANVVWFTGNTYPGPILPYETELAGYLDGGGRLFMSGQDILDQAAGQTDFVFDYLHVDWDGTETQNDKDTSEVHDVAGTLTDGFGDVPLDQSVLFFSPFMDQITPVGGAIGIFTDDAAELNALSVDTGTYKLVFLAFPFEEYGTGTQKADLMSAVMTYFGS